MKSGSNTNKATDAELCLDFAGTIDWRTSNHATDQLTTYANLIDWSRKKGLLGKGEAARLSELTMSKAGLGEGTVKEAIELREAIYRVFSAVAHKREASPEDLNVLNKHLVRSLQKTKLEASGDRYVWGWQDVAAPDMMLWPIARSAADLLTSDNLSTVRECANVEEGCGSLFLDYSKNQKKKWCSMESCGNRMKVKRYYDRHSRVKSV